MIIFKEQDTIPANEIVEKYLNKINFKGNREVSLDNLKQIHRLHPATLPFENISPLLEQAVLLDIESIYTKMILQNRGGYCFEHNLLLGFVLQNLGYNIRGLMARTLYNLPEGKNLFRGHMALLVDLDGQNYLADTGFGGLTLTGPLLMSSSEEQSTPHEAFRVIAVEDEYIIEAFIQQNWQALYMVSLHKTVVNDYELASWFHCKHPESRFTRRLVVTIAKADKRIVLLNNLLSTYSYIDGSIERKTISNPEELIDLLKNTFQIEVEDPKSLRIAFERITSNN